MNGRRSVVWWILALCVLLVGRQLAYAAEPSSPERVGGFLARAFANLPKTLPSSYYFKSWDVPGQETPEGVGLMPLEEPIDPDKVIARILDVDHYVGNIDYVEKAFATPDPRFNLPYAMRYHQEVKLPGVDRMQHELVLNDGGIRDGYRVIFWYDLQPEASQLDIKDGARSVYSVGFWLVSANAVGYGLSNLPVKDELGTGSWIAMTTGVDVLAGKIFRSNIKGMVEWARR